MISAGLTIIDVSDPAAPQLAHHDDTIKGSFITLAGQIAYIANGSGLPMDALLSIVDLSDPASPRMIGSYMPNAVFENITVSGDYVFAAIRSRWGVSERSDGGLEVIDVSDPANPRMIAYYATFGIPGGVAISGNYAYVVEKPHISLPPRSSAGLHVLDITDPANPRRVGGNTAFFAAGKSSADAGIGPIVAANGLIFMPLGTEGVAILPEYRPIQFDQLETPQSNERHFRIDGPPLVPGRLQRSPDLRTWTDWRSVMFGGSPLSISDSDALNPAAFYRFVAP